MSFPELKQTIFSLTLLTMSSAAISEMPSDRDFQRVVV